MHGPAFTAPTEVDRRNFRHLYWDIAWYGVVAGSVAAFLGIYAARLGASSFEIGLLTAGPAIVNLLFSLPSGRYLQGRPIVRETFLSSVWQRAGFLALAPLPFLFNYRGQVWAAILITLLMAVPGTLLAIAFNALFAEVVPSNLRAQVVGRRNAIIAVVVTLTVLACGQILDRVDFPHSYAIVFLMGGVGAMVSSYHLSRLKANRQTPEAGETARQNGQKPRSLLRLSILSGPFGTFMLAYLLFYSFQYIPIPLFPLFNVNVLNLTDGTISLGSALFYTTMMLGSLALARLTAFRGHRFLLIIGAFLYGIYPAMLYFAHSDALYLAANFIGGAIWAILNGGLVNRLMERVPEDDRPAYMAVHNLVLNIGILAGSLIGPALGDWFDLRTLMLISAVLRASAGVLFIFWG